MNVSKPFIARPIATSLLAIGVLLGGLLGYRLLPVSALPQVDFPTIQVATSLPGASPSTMASLVTASLERQLGQIPALEVMTSTSSLGLSQITLQFSLDRDIDSAAQDVQAAINAAGSTLPKNLPYPPVYSKVNPADTPILILALTSDNVPMTQMSDFADTLLAQRLSEVTGVGHVTVEGGIKPAVRIQADLTRLAAYGIGLEDLRNAIVNSNVAQPTGSLDGKQQSFTVSTNDQITVAQGYRGVIVAYRNNAPVRISDVANVIQDLENVKVAGWYQGRPAVVVDILRQPGANIVDTVTRILDQLPRLQSAFPNGVKLSIVSDRTGTIRASVHDVQFTLILSVGLVVAVVLVFLRTISATIIAGAALPLSIIATFGVMWFCGFSLDNLSLMALTIGTGFVVDDAIVMIENIVRHLEQGKKPYEAAMQGAAEIGFTVISLTVSLVCVFIPLLLMSGIVGRLFREFALTLTIAVVVSAVISLTLTPMMCSQILRPFKKHRRQPSEAGRTTGAEDESEEEKNEPEAYGRFVRAYGASLEWVLGRQPLVLLIAAATLAITVWLYIIVPKGFLPLEDTGLITGVLQAGQDVSIDEMQRLQAEVSDTLRRDPDVTGVVSLIGVGTTNPTPNSGHLAITLTPRDSRSATANQIIRRFEADVATIPGVTVFFQSVQDIQIGTRASQTQYQYTLVDTDAGELQTWSTRLAEQMRKEPSLRNVVSDLQVRGLATLVSVDRDTMSRLGITMQTIDDTLDDAFGQRQVSTIYSQSNQYRVVLEADPRFQRDPSALENIYIESQTASFAASQASPGATSLTGNASSSAVASGVPSATGNQVRLGVIARVVGTLAPLSISHQAQFPAVTISFDLRSRASLSDAVKEVKDAEDTIGMPPTVVGSYSGDAAEYAKSVADEPWLILAAVVVIYIVLGVLYESYIHPFTILTTLPSAGVGALLALLIFRQDLSVVGLIGIVLLMGIVKKNAIMMIDFALEAERNEGLSPRDSIVKASLLRFRPIMMTTAAALLGALPLALENGTGSELRFPLGITIIGGLLLSQLLTLYTTPVIYLYMERLRARLLEWRGGPARPAAPPAGPQPGI